MFLEDLGVKESGLEKLIERGFIKADVISYEDLIANGSMTAARDKGLVRSEGKEYVMQDGDVVLFKFNV